MSSPNAIAFFQLSYRAPHWQKQHWTHPQASHSWPWGLAFCAQLTTPHPHPQASSKAYPWLLSHPPPPATDFYHAPSMRGCTASAPAPPAEEAQCCPDQLAGVGVESREEAAHSASKWVSLKACFLLPSPIQASSCPTSPKTSLSLQGGLGKRVTIFSVTPLHHSTLSTGSFLSLLKHLWDTLAWSAPQLFSTRMCLVQLYWPPTHQPL